MFHLFVGFSIAIFLMTYIIQDIAPIFTVWRLESESVDISRKPLSNMKMTNRLTLLALVIASMAFVSPSAQAAYNIFLQGTGLVGESTSASHAQWIELYSVSQVLSNAVDSNTGGSSGRVQFSDISITKPLDKSSPLLIQNCNAGVAIASVTIDFERTGATPAVFYKVTLEDVLITSVKQSGSAGDDVVMETVTMSFARIRWAYYPIDPKTGKPGTKVETGWDVRANKKY